MKTSVEQLNPTRAKLTITATPDELKPHIDHAYEHIAETVQMPGFRKGKVPPALLDQRVGRMAILEHAVNDALDPFYRQAAIENKIQPLGRPEADIQQWPAEKDFTGDLIVTVEVDVRPDIKLPKLDGIKVTVEPAEATKEDIQEELDQLRSRFGNLVTVDRPAKKGDFVQLDLVATIGGKEVDTANSISYEIGSGELIEGIDDALETLTAGEETTFESKLLGGDHEGESAQIAVKVLTVKERELPKADDDFAQIASEFDTIKELEESLKVTAGQRKAAAQARVARDQITDHLLSTIDVPFPQSVVDAEVHRHLESEGRLEDDAHRAEVIEETEKSLKMQILLDTISDAEKVDVTEQELSQYLIQASMQYGMEPSEYARIVSENGQLPSVVAEIMRSQVLWILLAQANVVDTKGKKVDLSSVIPPINRRGDAGNADAEAKPVKVEKPKAEKPATADKAAKPAAKKPAAKKPATKK